MSNILYEKLLNIKSEILEFNLIFDTHSKIVESSERIIKQLQLTYGLIFLSMINIYKFIIFVLTSTSTN